MAPDHGHVGADLAADIVRRPVRALHVLYVEGPQPAPVPGALVRVAVQIEECGVLRLAPDRLDRGPVERAVGHEISFVQVEQGTGIRLRAADDLRFGHVCASIIAMSPSGVVPTKVSTRSVTPAAP